MRYSPGRMRSNVKRPDWSVTDFGGGPTRPTAPPTGLSAGRPVGKRNTRASSIGAFVPSTDTRPETAPVVTGGALCPTAKARMRPSITDMPTSLDYRPDELAAVSTTQPIIG